MRADTCSEDEDEKRSAKRGVGEWQEGPVTAQKLGQREPRKTGLHVHSPYDGKRSRDQGHVRVDETHALISFWPDRQKDPEKGRKHQNCGSTRKSNGWNGEKHEDRLAHDRKYRHVEPPGELARGKMGEQNHAAQ